MLPPTSAKENALFREKGEMALMVEPGTGRPEKPLLAPAPSPFLGQDRRQERIFCLGVSSGPSDCPLGERPAAPIHQA